MLITCRKVEKEAEKTLKELMTPELLAALQQPGAKEILDQWAANTLAHHKHPLYKEATNYWLETQAGQINKGAAKYPEPLNPSSWSFKELLDHAMQENVDQVHYITALRTKADVIAHDLELGKMAGNGLTAIFNMQDQPPHIIAEYALATARGYYRVWQAVNGDK